MSLSPSPQTTDPALPIIRDIEGNPIPESDLVPLTRESFMEDVEYIGATQTETMYVYVADGEEDEDGGGIRKVDVPESVKKTGVLPDGFSIDLIMDPEIVVQALKKQGIVYENQLPPEMLENIRSTICDPGNMSIVPTEIYESKLALILDSASRVGEAISDEDEDVDENEDEWETVDEEVGNGDQTPTDSPSDGLKTSA